ncbi:hypothetical protein [Streptomyces albicerus]|nr:hypothetical protein [Streptomyces albicerus]
MGARPDARGRPPEHGESIRIIAAGVKVPVGVVHKTLAEAKAEAQRDQ